MAAFPLEREIKLRFDTARAALDALSPLNATPLRPRRLQRDHLLDTPDRRLEAQRSVLRVRQDPSGSAVTFKGPVQSAAMKLREEIETPVEDAAAMLGILEGAGFSVWFRYEKYREEFQAPELVIAVDETPIGVFVELEGSEAAVAGAAAAIGCGPADYVLESYRGLFLADCRTRGTAPTDMLFGNV